MNPTIWIALGFPDDGSSESKGSTLCASYDEASVRAFISALKNPAPQGERRMFGASDSYVHRGEPFAMVVVVPLTKGTYEEKMDAIGTTEWIGH